MSCIRHKTPFFSLSEVSDAVPYTPLLERPGKLIGPYRVLRLLGAGGHGMVYLAEQYRPILRHVALKILRPGMECAAFLRRFENERQTLAMLNHPNIAQIFDAGTTTDGRPYFSMEYVNGTPIVEYSDYFKLNVTTRLHLFVDVCSAVDHAHNKGIIHRDLKPSNVLVSLQGDHHVPKVIDFGVAKCISPDIS